MSNTEPSTLQNLRAKEASQYLSIGLSTIWLYAKQGKLNPIKLSPRVTIFKRSELDSFVNSMREGVND